MPVNKPVQIMGGGGGGLPVTKRARDSANENRQALNAAMGLDNFARLLKSDSQKAVQMAEQQGMGKEYVPGLPVQGGLPMQVQPQAKTINLSEMQRLGMSSNPEDLQAFKNMSLLQKAMQDGEHPLMGVNSLKPLNSARLGGADAAALSLRVNRHKAQLAEKTAESVIKVAGTVSAMFESGKDGIAAIGYDSTGGTSYGKYQIASKTGTMNEFINFLQNEAPDLAGRLAGAGPADTGSKQGQMPKVWREIAAEEPERFAGLQQQFIHNSHFKPAMDKLSERTGLNEAELTPALAEMVFSTAVQHGAGGASRIIARALDAVGLEKLRSSNAGEAKEAEQNLIRQVYSNRSGQFVSSSGRVRESVQARLQTEMGMMLDMTSLA